MCIGDAARLSHFETFGQLPDCFKLLVGQSLAGAAAQVAINRDSSASNTRAPQTLMAGADSAGHKPDKGY